MHALEREIYSNTWITITLLFLLFLLAILKSFNSTKLKGTVFAIFKKGFVDEEIEENYSFFSGFNLILFSFYTIVISLVVYLFFGFFLNKFIPSFFSFTVILLSVFCYLLARWFLEYILSALLEIRNEVHPFLSSKSLLLSSISFGFFILIIFIVYAFNNKNVFLFMGILLLFTRFLVFFTYNKKLIISKLFYFILYICIFELGPLFILFKLIF
jgi:hypothetical protein